MNGSNSIIISLMLITASAVTNVQASAHSAEIISSTNASRNLLPALNATQNQSDNEVLMDVVYPSLQWIRKHCMTSEEISQSNNEMTVVQILYHMAKLNAEQKIRVGRHIHSIIATGR
jgi:hypothetical protein